MSRCKICKASNVCRHGNPKGNCKDCAIVEAMVVVPLAWGGDGTLKKTLIETAKLKALEAAELKALEAAAKKAPKNKSKAANASTAKAPAGAGAKKAKASTKTTPKAKASTKTTPKTKASTKTTPKTGAAATTKRKTTSKATSKAKLALPPVTPEDGTVRTKPSGTASATKTGTKRKRPLIAPAESGINKRKAVLKSEVLSKEGNAVPAVAATSPMLPEEENASMDGRVDRVDRVDHRVEENASMDEAYKILISLKATPIGRPAPIVALAADGRPF